MKQRIQILRIALIDNDQFSTEALIHIGGTQTWSAEDDENSHIFLAKNLNVHHKDGGVNSELLQLRDFLTENGFNAFSITNPVIQRAGKIQHINEIMEEQVTKLTPRKINFTDHETSF